LPGMGLLQGRTAIVTGSTGEGMGRQIAWTLAREGANVVLNYGTYRRSDTAARKAVAECKALGGDAIAVRADTRRESDTRRLVAAARKDFGDVHIAVANAGGDLIERSLDDTSLADWSKVVGAELDGAFLLAREVLPGMRRRRDGRIVSISWDRAASPSALPYDYAVGKAARDVLMAKLARSELRHGVTVNTVAPGAIPYPTDAQSKDLVRHGKAWTRRTRSWNQDVAEAVLWLCRDEARFVTGSRIEVAGEH
jgi:3-oxoacyl-[acyl-carrier protein] reductase